MPPPSGSLPPLRNVVSEGHAARGTIVFLHGWPDDASLWDGCVAALRDRYRCVRATLPSFAGDRAARWGYGTDAIIAAVERLIRDAAGAGPGGPVTLVMHDWGCYWGHAAHRRRPELVARVVGVEVSPHYRAPTLRALAGLVAYQGWLLGAFAVGGPVGDAMTRALARLARMPVDRRRLHASMNYPYRNFWADLISGRARRLFRGYWPSCPLLFVYGAKKPFPLHSAAWVEHVRSVGGQVVALPCGHWVPYEPQFVALLGQWLDGT